MAAKLDETGNEWHTCNMCDDTMDGFKTETMVVDFEGVMIEDSCWVELDVVAERVRKGTFSVFKCRDGCYTRDENEIRNHTHAWLCTHCGIRFDSVEGAEACCDHLDEATETQEETVEADKAEEESTPGIESKAAKMVVEREDFAKMNSADILKALEQAREQIRQASAETNKATTAMANMVSRFQIDDPVSRERINTAIRGGDDLASG